MYAASAWCGFTTAADRQWLDAVIRRAKRSCLCSIDLPSLAELIDNADDDFLNNILSNPYHVLHSTLPKETASSYAHRRRRHNRELLDKSSRLVQSCFVARMLYKYTNPTTRPISFIHFIQFYSFNVIVTLRFVKVLIKFYWLIDWLIEWYCRRGLGKTNRAQMFRRVSKTK